MITFTNTFHFDSILATFKGVCSVLGIGVRGVRCTIKGLGLTVKVSIDVLLRDWV